jgi:aryl-alcohol dehydrogenase-like predicted oxidoreductase
MEYTNLGRTGLKVSRLGLGTMNFGDVSDEQTSFEIMDAAIDSGINLFDTADVYGGPQKPDMEKGYGISEEIVGRWIKQRQARDKIVLATKLYQPMDLGPNDRRLSAYHIRKACEDSLRRLQTDRIDLYQMHHIDRFTPWEEIWQAFEILVQQGKVLYVGSSNFAAWHIASAQGAAAPRNFLGLVSEQSFYNLANRTIELEVAPACRDLGLGLLPWSPLARGLLGGVLQTESHGRRRLLGDKIERLRPQLEAYEAFCRELGEQPAAVALAWLLHNPAVTAPITGPRTRQQLLDNLRALDLSLSADALERLDRIWPGPGGEAPEAYAW